MFAHVRKTHLITLVGSLCVLSGVVLGADRFLIDQSIPILTPDDPSSVAVIELPSGETVWVKVVSVSDVSTGILLGGEALDPSLPARIPITIQTPDGNTVHVNVVEIGRRGISAIEKRALRYLGDWVINDESPLTAEAEVEALIAGEQARVPRDNQSPQAEGPTCHLTGLPVVELFVWFDPDAIRRTPPNYGIRIIEPPEDPGGVPSTNRTDENNGFDAEGGGEDPPPGEGADPIGSPDKIPPRH